MNAKISEALVQRSQTLRDLCDGPPHDEVMIRRFLLWKSTLRELTETLRAYEVDHLILKGIPLAMMAWEHPFKRQSGDIDLLVRYDEFPRAVAILEESGWQRTLERPFHPIVTNQLSLHRRPFNALVEVHWSVAAPFRSAPAFDSMWAQRTCVDGISTLSPSWQLIHLSLHFTQHLGLSYRDLLDAAFLIDRFEPDLTRVYGQAQHEGCATSLTAFVKTLEGVSGQTLVEISDAPACEALAEVLAEVIKGDLDPPGWNKWSGFFATSLTSLLNDRILDRALGVSHALALGPHRVGRAFSRVIPVQWTDLSVSRASKRFNDHA